MAAPSQRYSKCAAGRRSSISLGRWQARHCPRNAGRCETRCHWLPAVSGPRRTAAKPFSRRDQEAEQSRSSPRTSWKSALNRSDIAAFEPPHRRRQSLRIPSSCNGSIPQEPFRDRRRRTKASRYRGSQLCGWLYSQVAGTLSPRAGSSRPPRPDQIIPHLRPAICRSSTAGARCLASATNHSTVPRSASTARRSLAGAVRTVARSGASARYPKVVPP